MRILVTGASGFLAQHLIPALLKAGHEVACLTRKPEQLPATWGNLRTATPDRDGLGIRSLCLAFKPELVVHLAAGYTAEHRYEDISALVDANLMFSAHLLDAMQESGCHAMVWAGTSWQHYEGADYRPANLYAAMKQAVSTLAEYYLDRAGLRLLELHLYDSYGENDPRPRLLNLLRAHAKNGDALSMSPGEQKLHLVHVDDLVRGIQQACGQVMSLPAGTRRVYRLPSNRKVTLRELVDQFNAITPSLPVHVNWGARPYREREVFDPWEGADILPDWHPTIDLAQGLQRLRLRPLVE